MKDWLYFLTDESGRSYYLQNGIVKTSASPRPLTYTPDGWQDIAIAWERNMQKIGTVRNFSLPLGFVLDGATILRNMMYDRTIEEKLYLLIQKLGVNITLTEYALLYQYFYKGELDLSTMRGKDSDTKMMVNVMEGGLSKLLKANEGTIYEFDLPDEEAITVKMDGLKLNEKHNYLITGDVTYEYSHFFGIAPISKEGAASGFAAFGVTGAEIPPGYDYSVGTEYAFAVTQDIPDMRIFGRFTFDAMENPWAAWLRTSTGRNIKLAELLTPVAGDRYSIDFDVTFSGFAGEKFFLVDDFADGFMNLIERESTFSIEYKSRYKTTYVRAFKPSTLFKKLIEKITGSELNADTSFIEQYDRFVITSGDGVRSLAGAKVKTSLNQFFESFKTILCAGQGIENGKVLIHELSHFLDESNPVHLGSAKNLEPSYATDLMANTFKIGYESKQIDDVNGKYEFNNKHIYTSPVTRIVKELPITSPYNAQPYLIEITRINLDGKTTTDDKSDNQVFVIDVVGQSFVPTEIIAAIDNGNNFLRFIGSIAQLDQFQPGATFTLSGGTSNNSSFTVIFAIAAGADILVSVEETVTPGTITGATVNLPYTLNRPAYTITGLPDPDSIFNIDLSPKRILLKWQRYINSLFYKFDGDKLKIASIDRNPDVKTILAGETIEEKADLALTTDRLFLPFYFEFDTEVPIDLVSLLEENPNRCFSFEWMGSTFTGFLMKAGIAPNTNKEQAYKLLAAPSNDLTNLI